VRTVLKTLTNTIEKWQQPVIDAVLISYSNAKAEARNRTAKVVVTLLPFAGHPTFTGS
jgi:hypothetical protein